jgi:hypothetical protein
MMVKIPCLESGTVTIHNRSPALLGSVILGSIISILGSLTPAGALTFITEDFSYSDGDITTESGGNWTAHSGAGSNPVQVMSGQAVLGHGTGSREDVSRSFTTTTSGTVYYGFTFFVFDNAAIAPSNNQTFAHFNTGTFTARVGVVPGTSGDYTLGLSNNSNSADVTWGTDFTFNTVHRLVVEYDLTSKQSRLWVDATSITDTNISTTTASSVATLSHFALRQADSTNDETITIDNLTIATTFTEAAVPFQVSDWVGFSTLTLLVLFRYAQAKGKHQAPYRNRIEAKGKHQAPYRNRIGTISM